MSDTISSAELARFANEQAPDLTPIESDSKKAALAKLAEQQVALEEEIEELELLVKEKNRELSKINGKDIPDLMREIGMLDFRLTNGARIEIATAYSAKIPEESKEDALTWMKKWGFAALLKCQVVIPFKKGDDELATRLAKALVAKGFRAEYDNNVHPQTLKKFVRERYENEEPILDPDTGEEVVFNPELFGAKTFQYAKVTLPKTRK